MRSGWGRATSAFHPPPINNSRGHPVITVIACQLAQVIRTRLRQAGEIETSVPPFRIRLVDPARKCRDPRPRSTEWVVYRPRNLATSRGHALDRDAMKTPDRSGLGARRIDPSIGVAFVLRCRLYMGYT